MVCARATSGRQQVRGMLALAMAVGGLPMSVAWGAVVMTGDVTPTSIDDWYGSECRIGNTSSGALTLNEGSYLFGNSLYLGHGAGSDGTLTLDRGSFVSLSTITVGYFGNGTVNVLSTPTSGVSSFTSNTFTDVARLWDAIGRVNVIGPTSHMKNTSGLSLGGHGDAYLNIEAGGRVESSYAYVADYGSAEITVTGTGSKWTVGEVLRLGYQGPASLTVSDGGQVVITRTLEASLSSLHGNGTISASGAVLDADMVFDATHGLTQNIPFGSGGVLSLTIAGSGQLGVGHQQSGTLRIADGRVVASPYGYLGTAAGSSGSALVTGAGTSWNNTNDMYVGLYGQGQLTIAAGGHVNSQNGQVSLGDESGAVLVTGAGSQWNISKTLNLGRSGSGSMTVESGGVVTTQGAYIGYDTDAVGQAVIRGAGSKWTNSATTYVGFYGKGSLEIGDGGQVVTRYLIINEQSSARVNVSGDSMLVLGNATTAGYFENLGVVRLVAGNSVAPGVYKPITEFAGRQITWSGTGSMYGLGGVWNPANETFTVSPVINIAAGANQAIASGQRLVISDGDQSVAVSFGTVGDGVNFSATPLDSVVSPAGEVLSAWDFTTSLSGGNVLLAFDVGEGISQEFLSLWHFDGATWEPYTTDTLNYSGGVVSFEVTAFSAYAVAVPEPTVMMTAGAVALITLGRRRYQRRR